MTIINLTTLLIASAALLTSVVSVMEMKRQRENNVRPVLVVLEKPLDSKLPDSPLVLYLVNMGQAVAMNTRVWWKDPPTEGKRPERLQSEVFPGRRAELMRQHSPSCVNRTAVFATYTDVDGKEYSTEYTPQNDHTHKFDCGPQTAPLGHVEYEANGRKEPRPRNRDL